MNSICFFLYLLVFCNWFVFKCFLFSRVLTFSSVDITFEITHLLSCWFHYVDICCTEFRPCKTFTIISYVTRTLFIEILDKFSEKKNTSYELRVQIHDLLVQIHELWVQIQELQVQIHELRVKTHVLRVQILELRVQIHELKY